MVSGAEMLKYMRLKREEAQREANLKKAELESSKAKKSSRKRPQLKDQKTAQTGGSKQGEIREFYSSTKVITSAEPKFKAACTSYKREASQQKTTDLSKSQSKDNQTEEGRCQVTTKNLNS